MPFGFSSSKTKAKDAANETAAAAAAPETTATALPGITEGDGPTQGQEVKVEESESDSDGLGSYVEQFMNSGLTVLNPCKCCMRCCGKNALRLGAFVVAVLYIADGVGNGFPVLFPIMFPDSVKKDEDNVEIGFFYNLEMFSKIVRNNLPVVIVVVLLSFYTIACGVLLIMANITRRRRLCSYFNILAGLDVFFSLAQMLFVTAVIHRDKDPYRSGRSSFLVLWWIGTCVRMICLTYYFLVGFALYVEVKDKQNRGKVLPQVIEWEGDNDVDDIYDDKVPFSGAEMTESMQVELNSRSTL